MTYLPHILTFFGVLLATWGATSVVLIFLKKASVLDHPNERSSHTMPTPRGGGLAVATILTPTWVIIGTHQSENMSEIWLVSACALALAALSWFDDLKGLSARWRLLGQLVAVILSLSVMTHETLYFGGLLPSFLDVFVAGILWIWFINLFNFMDGIDGISGVEAACIGIGVALISVLTNLGGDLLFYGGAIAAAALGFLWWNWHPAKVFLGDVGSITFGFLLGWLMLSLLAKGQWAPALILPLYYLMDASVTLTRRAFQGKKIWLAHREHFYQRAVQNGASHSQVTLMILAANVVLMMLSIFAAFGYVLISVVGAFIGTAAFLLFLGATGKRQAS